MKIEISNKCFFFFSSRRRHTRFDCDWSSDVCSSDLLGNPTAAEMEVQGYHAPQGVFDGLGGVERVVAEKIGPTRMVNDVKWAGVESTHFAAVWIPPTVPGTVELRTI